VIVTGMGDARNVINVLSSRVVVACGVEGAGTASEIALALKSGVPVVLLRAHPEATALFRRLGRSLVHEATTPDEAVRVIEDKLMKGVKGEKGELVWYASCSSASRTPIGASWRRRSPGCTARAWSSR
jgi:urocanate hydratase